MILSIIIGFFLFSVVLGFLLGWYVRGAYPAKEKELKNG